MIVSASFENELVLLVHLLECREKQRSKSRSENFETDKETFPASLPFLLECIVSASGHDAMEMWMNVEFLTPRMENREETDFAPKYFFSLAAERSVSLTLANNSA